MSGRNELPDVAGNAIEQLIEECEAVITRLLWAGTICLGLALLAGLLLVASLPGHAS